MSNYPAISQHPNDGKSAKLSYILILLSSFTWVSGFIYPNENNIKPWISFGSSFSLYLQIQKLPHFIQIKKAIYPCPDPQLAWMQYKLPLPILHNINNSMSIFVMLIELKLQGKTLDPTQKKATFLAVLGLLILSNYQYLEPIIRPSYQFQSQFQNYQNISAFGIVLWSLVLLFAVILASIAIYMTNLTEMNTFQICFHYSLPIILINSFLYNIFSYHTQATKMYKCLFFGSLIHGVGQILFAGSIVYSTNLGVTMILGCFTVVVSYFYSIFRYHEQISIFSIFGSAFIIWAIYKIFLDT